MIATAGRPNKLMMHADIQTRHSFGVNDIARTEISQFERDARVSTASNCVASLKELFITPLVVISILRKSRIVGKTA